MGQSKANTDLAAGRRAFTAGALGIAPAVLKQTFTGGRGHGMTWSRRPMTHDELARTGLALSKGLETIEAALGEEILAQPPEQVLAGIDGDDEFLMIGADWIAEAEAELERRRQIVDDERLRRSGYED